MSTLLITNAQVVTPQRLLPKSAVLVEDGRIAAVGAPGDLAQSAPDETVDAVGAFLAPGFIDLHCHGLLRWSVDAGAGDLAEICGALPRYGVTGWLPTLCPRPKGEDAEYAATLAEAAVQGAAVLGLHYEGPFLTLTGALPPEAIGEADPRRVRSLMEAAAPHRAVFSVAPDFEGVLDLIPLMTSDGAPVFMTHTAADVAQTRTAIEAGVRHATHFFDVFPHPPETEPGARPCGVVEAVLADPRVSVDFILDGEHVHPVAVELALRCKGPDGVCLITDASLGAGLPPGRYEGVGGEEVTFAYEGAPARLGKNSRLPGALAGSGLTMDRAVRNAVEMLGLDVPQAVRMASTSPAHVLGLGQRKGRVEEGFDADLVLLDEGLHVLRTWVGGRCVHAAES